MRRILPVALALLLAASGCSGADDPAGAPGPEPTSTAAPETTAAPGTTAAPSTTAAPTTGATSTTSAAPGPSAAPPASALAVTTVARDLDTVWSMAFDPSGKLWFTERRGRLSQLGGPTRSIPGVVEQGEGGLMGVEIDARGRFYLMFTSLGDNRIVRLDRPDAEPRVLVDGLRKASIHNGGRLRFGPDGTLYAGTGDAADTSLPQDDGSLNGKILRVDPEAGNPAVFSKGHRNAHGLCFDRAGRFLSTEHGPDRGDEINLITQGGNGGWPNDAGNGIKNYTPTIAPAGCAVYESDLIPQWKGSMLFVTLKGQDLRRLTFGPDGSVAGEEVLYDREFGRLRDVAVGPDGAVYLATSNKDTRGDPRAGDDKILRIAPR